MQVMSSGNERMIIFMDNKIRVLHIIGIVCGGGVEKVVMNYYKHIDRSKIQFDFVIDGYNKSIIDDEIRSLGGRVYHIESYKKNIIVYMWQLYKIIKKNNYSIVHSHINSLGFFSLFPAWMANAKLRLLHNHSTANKGENMRYWLKCMLRPFAPLFANRFLACSYLAGEWMYGPKMMKQGKVTIVNNAIDLEDYAFDENMRLQYRKEMNIPEDAKVIGHVGRFVFQKNHSFLIDVFKQIRELDKTAYLVLIGDGELKSSMQQMVDRYHLTEYVKFLGLREDVQKIYNVMDVFVLPSWFEGLPVVSIEAQANGLPCVFSSYVTKESKLTNNVEFLKISEGKDVWCDRIIKKNRSPYEFVIKEMQDAGFDINIQASKLISLYDRVL